MARPRKEPEIIYTPHINLRLTDVQYEIISENARQSELSLSEFIRRPLTDLLPVFLSYRRGQTLSGLRI